MHDETKHIIDALSLGGVVATIMGMMPNFAALASFIWFCIRIYESKTVQGWLKK